MRSLRRIGYTISDVVLSLPEVAGNLSKVDLEFSRFSLRKLSVFAPSREIDCWLKKRDNRTTRAIRKETLQQIE